MPDPVRAESSRLPALLGGAYARDEHPSPWWRRAATAAGVSAAALVATDLADPSQIPWSVGGVMLLVVAGGLRRHGMPRRVVYRHLGRAQVAWRAAGADNRQLAVLDEAHRLWAMTPPVGYRDRRTTINPLADAFAIFTSPAWRDPWLADHQLSIDPVVEAAEILDHTFRVTRLLADVRRQLQVLPGSSGAAQAYRSYERALLGSLDDALRRSRALTAYRRQVGLLEQALASSRALADAEAFGDRVLDLVSESARQELATAHLDDSRTQLQSLERGLREITDLLGSVPELPAGPRT